MRNHATVMASILGVSLLGGCQSVENSKAQPDLEKLATIDMSDAKTVAAFKSELAKAMNKRQIALGPQNEKTPSRFSVLPPALSPEETKSAAMPTPFELIYQGDTCYAKNLNDGTRYKIDSSICQILD